MLQAALPALQQCSAAVRLVEPAEYSLKLDNVGVPLAYNELAYATSQPFEGKVRWFKAQLDMLRVPFESAGKVALQVRRATLLQDAFVAVASLQPQQLQMSFQFDKAALRVSEKLRRPAVEGPMRRSVCRL